MNEFNRTTKNMILLLLAISVFLLVLGVFIRDTSFLNTAFGEVSYSVYASGVIFGIVFSIIKIFMIRFSLTSSLRRSKNKATLVSFGQYMVRLILSGIVLYISIKVDFLDFFGTMLGVIALQPASYLTGYLIRRDVDEDKIKEIQKDLDI